MDGVSRSAGSWTPLTVSEGPHAGTYRLSPMTLEDYGVVEQKLLAQRKTPLDAILPELDKVKDPRVRQMLVRMAYQDMRKDKDSNKVPVMEVYDYLDSIDGLMFTAWLGLRKNHPDVTEEKARQIMNAVGAEEFKRLRDQAAGTDPRGNLTGPSPAGTGRAPDSSSPGDASTGTSPSNTAGPPPSSTD